MRITSSDTGLTLDLDGGNIRKFQDVLAIMVISISAYNAITVGQYDPSLKALILPQLAEINALLAREYMKFVPDTEEKQEIESEIIRHTGANSVN